MAKRKVSKADFKKALEIGRPPNIKSLFPNSRALIVSGKAIDRAMIAKGRRRVSNERLHTEDDNVGEAKGATNGQELVTQRHPAVRRRSVFVSHQFDETEYIGGLISLLEKEGFTVITGRSCNTYISQVVLKRIREAELFLSLMTRDKQKADGTYTTSPWLLEEIGAALAFGKPIVLIVEEGIDDIGGLQGDWQRIVFGPKGFLKAAIDAVEQLNSHTSGKRQRGGYTVPGEGRYVGTIALRHNH